MSVIVYGLLGLAILYVGSWMIVRMINSAESTDAKVGWVLAIIFLPVATDFMVWFITGPFALELA